MAEKTLVILAAGIGSRFGGGIKQLTPVDDDGHLIIDYSIHDAIAAGFNRIIFIIRHDIEADFRTAIGDRIEKVCSPLGVKVDYAFQELSDAAFKVPAGRTKPWGTGHAVLCCRNLIDGPFAVINADDYYGREGFQKAARFIEKTPDQYGLIGYWLRNTLSEHGGVTRGICTIRNGRLQGIKETGNIIGDEYGIRADGKHLDPGAVASMNFWCFPKVFLADLFFGFMAFHDHWKDPLKDEFLLPVLADDLLNRGFDFTVMISNDQWYGMTYKEDVPAVKAAFREMIEAGLYHKDLYSDL